VPNRRLPICGGDMRALGRSASMRPVGQGWFRNFGLLQMEMAAGFLARSQEGLIQEGFTCSLGGSCWQ